jgi:hypothetical protein
VVSEYLAQDEYGALASRQNLQGCHEGQRDGFGLFIARLGIQRQRGLEKGIGIWLKPDDFAEPSRLGQVNLHVPLLGRASAGRAKNAEAPVGGYPVEPGAHRGPLLESVEALPRCQQGVLQGVLGVLKGSQHPVAVHLQLAAVWLGQLSKRLAVPGPRPGNQIGCHHVSPLFPRGCFHLPVSTPAGPRTGRTS